MWTIDTAQDMVCSGSFLVIEGMFKAETYDPEPIPAVDFMIYGGMQNVEEGITTWPAQNAGYWIKYDFDERFFTASPPFYPTYDTGTGIEEDPVIPADQPLFRVQGNPFHDRIFVTVSSGITGEVNARLMDISGRTVMEAGITGECYLPGENLPCGTYVLVLETPDGNLQSMKVVKI